MPFLAPAIPALIGGGAAIGSSLLGSALGSNSGTSAQSNVLNLNAQAMKTGQGVAGGLFPQGQSLIGQGAQGYQPVLNYYSSILSGNRPAMTSALAPEISRIGQGYNTAATTSAALNPRSGPSASFLADLPFQQQRDVSTLLQTARPQAAQGLLGASGATTGAGSNILNAGLAALYGSTSAGGQILQQQQQQEQLNAQRGNQIGAGLFSMYQQYGLPALKQQFPGLFGGMGGGGGGGASGNLTTNTTLSGNA